MHILNDIYNDFYQKPEWFKEITRNIEKDT